MRTLERPEYDCIQVATMQPLLATKIRQERVTKIAVTSMLDERQQRTRAAECIQRVVRRYQARQTVNRLRRMRELSLFIDFHHTSASVVRHEMPVLVNWSSSESLPSLSSLSSVDWEDDWEN